MDVDGFRIEDVLHAGARSRVVRAVRLADGTPVVLKASASDHPSPAEVQRIERERELLELVDDAPIARCLGTARLAGAPVLVLEDGGFESLAAWSGGKALELRPLLDIGERIARALVAVHRRHVVHRDLNPTNLLIHPGDRTVRLIDFELATHLPRGEEALLPPTSVLGTLAYISPEQTGRLNRVVDARSDLYSLGVTLFELATGRRPFEADDPADLIHQHLARRPPSALAHRPELPRSLAAIVRKLLRKAPEERYQSAAGVAHDLRRCLDSLDVRGAVDDFEPGARDAWSQLRIPQVLYGRTELLAQLRDAWARAATGRAECVGVAGPSGVGKTRLVQELRADVAARRGRFATGKFDQYRRGVPFASLSQALRGVVGTLLAEPEASLARWRRRLTDAVGPAGSLLVDVLPDLRPLLGDLPPVPDLPAAEAARRFAEVLDAFVRSLCRPDAPLCLFLDDLQWVDSATLDWLETTLGDDGARHLLVVAALRDDEVGPGHPLRVTLARLAASPAPFLPLTVQPLAREDVARLVAHALGQSASDIAPLAHWLHDRSEGNPLFVGQLLERLVADGAVSFDADLPAWTVDLVAAREAALPDDVVGLFLQRLRDLPADTGAALSWAAWLGGRFDPRVLARALELDEDELRARLRPAREASLLLPDDPQRLRFLHDRVQEAARGLLPSHDEARTRLRIGRLLADDEARLFEAVAHLNAARDLLKPEERQQLVHRNLRAARQAREATAYAPAAALVQAAMDAAGDAPDADLALELHLEAAHCAHLERRSDDAHAHFARALTHAGTVAAEVRVLEARAQFLTTEGRFREAYTTLADATGRLGFPLPARFLPPALLGQVALARARAGGDPATTLAALPPAPPDAAEVIRLASLSLKNAAQFDRKLAVLGALRLLNYCLRRGQTGHTGLAELVAGMIFAGGVLGFRRFGARFGELAVATNERLETGIQRAEVNFVSAYFAVAWTRGLAAAEQRFEVAFRAGIDEGDLFHASCASAATIQSQWMRGVRLDRIWQESTARLRFLRRVRSPEAAGAVIAVRRAIRALGAGEPEDDEGFDEAAFVADLQGYESGHFAHYWYVNRTQTAYLLGDLDGAREAAAQLDRYVDDSLGMHHLGEHRFWRALVDLADGRTRRPRSVHRQFVAWAELNPGTFGARAALLGAELDCARGREDAALRAYDRAIEAASQADDLPLVGLAASRASALLADRGQTRLGALFARDAQAAWRRWGATRLLSGAADGAGRTRSTSALTTVSLGSTHAVTVSHRSTGTTGGLDLDADALMKAAGALSRHVELNPLLSDLMHLAVGNAGAERGVLLLADPRGWRVAAIHRVDEDRPELPDDLLLDGWDGVCAAVAHVVDRSGTTWVVADARSAPELSGDPWVAEHAARSLLGMPLMSKGRPVGLLVLENHLSPGAFDASRQRALELLAGQMAISIDNALLYERLEERVAERTQTLERERARSDELLRNILPREVAEELKRTGRASARRFDAASVLFLDLVGFTAFSRGRDPERVVEVLGGYFRGFDEIVADCGLEKIKTIGDAYMCAGGLPEPSPDHAVRALLAGLRMNRFVAEEAARGGEASLSCRIGVHSGPVVAGVVGTHKFAFDIWGDTVNTASRVEGAGEPGRINASRETWGAVERFFLGRSRGALAVKGRGEVAMVWVDRLRPEYSADPDGVLPNDALHDALRAMRAAWVARRSSDR